MHFKNGREAKNGDTIILIPGWGPPVVGVLYDAVAGNDACNGYIAPIGNQNMVANLSECLHMDDFLAAIPANIPDTATYPA